jgi:hypothetical protein
MALTAFRLAKAHPAQRALVEATIRTLLARYPFVKLLAVDISDTDEGDTSLADTDQRGIHLSAMWFGQPPEILQAASARLPQMRVGDVTLPWHVAQDREPRRVITHEFGHCLEMGHPPARTWARERWRAATENSTLAPSLYGLSDPLEFWAESFAEYDLGLAPPDRAAAVRAVLRTVNVPRETY